MSDERDKLLDDIDTMTDNIDEAYSGIDTAITEYGNAQLGTEEQPGLLDQQMNFTVEKIEQQKADAQKELQKEQKNAYADYQKQVNPYGVNAEQMAQMGMSNTGYSETSKVAMYTAYQNRIALARESYDKAILDYNNSITEARLQNSVSKAQIAFQTLQMRLEYVIEGIGKKMSMLQTKASMADSQQQTYLDILDALNGGTGTTDAVTGGNGTTISTDVFDVGDPIQEAKNKYEERTKNGFEDVKFINSDVQPDINAEKQKAFDDIKANGITSVETAKQRLSEFGIDPTGHIMPEQQWNQLKKTQPDNIFANGIESYHDYLTFITLLLLEQSQ